MLTIPALLLLAWPAATARPADLPALSSAPAVTAVAGVCIPVADLDKAVAFYTDALDFTPAGWITRQGDDFDRLMGLHGATGRAARLRLGQESIELMALTVPPGDPIPPDSRSNDRWFQHIAIVVRDMDQAHTRLHEHVVRHASVDPQRLPDWNVNAAGIRAFYFRDPDGHFLELIEFPAGKGDRRWHEAKGALFLGIDHTAIVVGDTDASVRFYRDVLGLHVAGSSENYGPEQEALNSIPGAHLRITTLRAQFGPGIELLEYLQPRDGRPYPPDARTSDLVAWQTVLRTADIERLSTAFRDSSGNSSTAPVVDYADALQDGRKALLGRDVDGHFLRVIEP